jgi:hypothetical protein
MLSVIQIIIYMKCVGCVFALGTKLFVTVNTGKKEEETGRSRNFAREKVLLLGND